MEQKSFYSEIKVQSSSESITTIPAIHAFPAVQLSGWNRSLNFDFHVIA